MNKYIIACALLGLTAMWPLCAQSGETADQQLQNFPAGGIRQADMQALQDIDAAIVKSLSQAPNDFTGKKSPWYPKLQAWEATLHRAALSGKEIDVFAMIPSMADFFERDKDSEYSGDYLMGFETQMYDCGKIIILTAAAYIKQQNGAVDSENISKFVKLFSVPGFALDPDWEDESMPIDSAGLMIINPKAVVHQLESLPWQQAQQFIGNRTPAQFFENYTSNSDGLSVLKAKYATQQGAINAEFKQLVLWEWQQEQAHAH